MILTLAPESRSRLPCHTALQLVAERGHANITELLAYALDIDLEVADSRGLTPLFIAWRKGHLDVVEVIRHGAISTGSPNIW
jgi:ankyrin repeat protein